MLERFLSYIREKKIVSQDKKILLAVSGGQDSMVMTHLFHQAGYVIALAHINHRLRGKESDLDATLVRNYAEKYNIPFFQLDIDPTEFSSGNMQDKARKIRYAWLYQLAEEHHFDKIATAHHKDDMVETYFINLMRGSGLSGLDGIEAINGKIIRPLLFATRKEIEDFSTENSVNYREDSSNKSNKYLRNKLRNNILPSIYETDIRSYSGIVRSIENLSDTKKLLDFLIEKVSSEIITHKPTYISIQLNTFNTDPIYVQWLFHLIKTFGFNIDQTSDIINSKTSSGKSFLTDSHEAITDRAQLIIRRKGQVFNFDREIIIHSLPFSHEWADRKIIISEVSFEGKSMQDTHNTLYLNADRLTGKVILRGIMPGDKFKPSGMGGKSQVLSDFFTNHKVNLFDKEKLVVMTHDHEIIAIPGFRKSEKMNITPGTKKIWRIELIKQSNIDSIPGQ